MWGKWEENGYARTCTTPTENYAMAMQLNPVCAHHVGLHKNKCMATKSIARCTYVHKRTCTTQQENSQVAPSKSCGMNM